MMKLKASQSESSILAKCETLYSSIQDVLTPHSVCTLHSAYCFHVESAYLSGIYFHMVCSPSSRSNKNHISFTLLSYSKGALYCATV